MRRVLDTLASVAMLAAAVVMFLYGFALLREDDNRTPPVPTEAISLEGAPTLGDANAKVVLIEYSDFQCPACRALNTTVLPEVIERFVKSGLIRLAYRHNPLSQIHPLAFGASVASVCASRQDRFWEMKRALFDSVTLSPELLRERAGALGLELTAFDQCLADESALDLVRADKAGADALGLRSTPVLLIGKVGDDGAVRVKRVVAGVRSARAIAWELQKVLYGPMALAGVIGAVCCVAGGTVVARRRRLAMRRS